jgi:FdrA protein
MNAQMSTEKEENCAGLTALLAAPPRVINIGLELFAEDLVRQGAQVVHVRWAPPAGGNAQLAGLLAKLRS